MKNIFYPEKAKAKILLIDDEEDICVYLKAVLERTKKFEVFTSTQPIEGVFLAKKVHPDLIVLDILMPGMDGTQVAQYLQEDITTKDIPVLFLTVLVRREEVRLSKGLIGGHPFIAKPVETEELIARIEVMLQKECPAN